MLTFGEPQRAAAVAIMISDEVAAFQCVPNVIIGSRPPGRGPVVAPNPGIPIVWGCMAAQIQMFQRVLCEQSRLQSAGS